MPKHMYILINYKILIIIRAEILEVRMVNLKISKGFTLAEVLITLGIIGVVAAITIPNLITEHQKRTTVTKLQKAISVMNQAYRLSYDELGEPSLDESFAMGQKYFKTYWAPYIKTSSLCNTYQECGYDSLTPWTFADGSKDTTYVVMNSYNCSFYTMDGIFYVVVVAGGKSGGGLMPSDTIYVDVNGGKKPNVWGKDVFRLTRVIKDNGGGGVQPFYYTNSNSVINSDCSKKGKGYTCAEKIKRAGWKIDKDYPWK